MDACMLDLGSIIVYAARVLTQQACYPYSRARVMTSELSSWPVVDSRVSDTHTWSPTRLVLACKTQLNQQLWHRYMVASYRDWLITDEWEKYRNLGGLRPATEPMCVLVSDTDVGHLGPWVCPRET